jgi:hypothetical protein
VSSWRTCDLSQKARESRQPLVRASEVLEIDDAADGWWIGALRVAEAGAEPEAGAIRLFDQQRAHAALMFAVAREMAYDARLCFQVGFDLEPVGDLIQVGRAQKDDIAASQSSSLVQMVIETARASVVLWRRGLAFSIQRCVGVDAQNELFEGIDGGAWCAAVMGLPSFGARRP